MVSVEQGVGHRRTVPHAVVMRRAAEDSEAAGQLGERGVFAALELGGFAPYMLCLYLPLVPWERLVGHVSDVPADPAR